MASSTTDAAPPLPSPKGTPAPDNGDFIRVATSEEQRFDLALAVSLLVASFLSAALTSAALEWDEAAAPLWSVLIYAPLITLPLAFRRRWPATVAVVVAVAYFFGVTWRVPELYVANVAVFISLYTVGAWMNDRRRAFAVRVGIIVGMFGWLIVVMYREALFAAEDAELFAGVLSPYVALVLLQLLINVMFFGGAYYFGERTWAAAQEKAVLAQRTVELERERERTAAQAVALDRVRIARELHDVVAHHVSVMGVQAGAARVVLDRDPERARAFMSDIEGGARDAIGDFRQLLETLREPGDSTEAGATDVTLDDLPALVEASSRAGLPSQFTIVGAPVPVPALVAVNLYRIAQEALTNARRHGGAYATADVRLRYLEGAVELEVVNTGRLVTSTRSGLGQLGMRERAVASGGTIEMGPRSDGGFRVRACIPLALASGRDGKKS